MAATEAEELAMEISDEQLWHLGDYSLQVNREGHLQVTFPVIAVRNMELSAGDLVSAYLDRRSGGLVLAPAEVELGSAEA